MQAEFIICPEKCHFNHVSPVIIFAYPFGIAVFMQAGGTICAEKGPFNQIPPVIIFADRFGIAVFMQAGFTICPEKCRFNLISPIVIFADPFGIAAFIQAGFTICAEKTFVYCVPPFIRIIYADCPHLFIQRRLSCQIHIRGLTNRAMFIVLIDAASLAPLGACGFALKSQILHLDAAT